MKTEIGKLLEVDRDGNQIRLALTDGSLYIHLNDPAAMTLIQALAGLVSEIRLYPVSVDVFTSTEEKSTL